MKLELRHTIVNGRELYSVWLNGTTLHQSCKTKDEAMVYYNDLKALVNDPVEMPKNRYDLCETILTEEI